MDYGKDTERRGDSPRRRWPSGLVGMLAVLAAVELGLSWTAAQVQRQIPADYWQLDRATRGAAVRRAEILCLGDSLVKNDVIPAALEARLDRPAYNLAALGAPAPVSYFLLRHALEAGARPRAIVVDANASQLRGIDYRQNVANLAEVLRSSEAWGLARINRDPEFFGLYLVHRSLASVRHRFELRSAIRDRLASAPAEEAAPWREVFERQGRRNQGACLLPSAYAERRFDPYAGGKLPPIFHEEWYSTGPFADPTSLVYLDRLLALAESRGIAVFFLVPPIHPGVIEVRERMGLESRYLEFVRRLHGRYANLVVVDGRHAGYDSSKFLDPSHLHLESATAMSSALAEVIAGRLDGPPGGDRWVSLPPYAEPKARLAVEDFRESMDVVHYWHKNR